MNEYADHYPTKAYLIHCRSAIHIGDHPPGRTTHNGFRVALTAK